MSPTPFLSQAYRETSKPLLISLLAESLIGGREAPPDVDDWPEWLAAYYPHVCTAPFAERHIRLWEWFEALLPGVRPRSRVEVWPRGGGKSSSGELGVVRLGSKLSRVYVLYVSDTQEQADKHVQSIANLFETLGMDRALNRFGQVRGWRRDQLRTANGFNVSGFGLEGALRGIKLDQYRPDLIIFDDIDDITDSPLTVDRKIKAITQGILPAGSPDCAVLFLQNLVHDEGIVAQIVDGRADFLKDREPCFVEPAVRGLQTEDFEQPDGTYSSRITAGEATWEGQSIEVCEQQINTWGYRAFDIEAQHNVRRSEGEFFKVDRIHHAAIAPTAIDYLSLAVYQGTDLAISKKSTADWTVNATIGVDADQNLYILDVKRDRLDFNETLAMIAEQYAIWTTPPGREHPGNKPIESAIETVAYQASVFEEAKRRYMLPFAEVKPSKDLMIRSHLLAARMATGKMFANKGAEWWPELLKELNQFPGGRHDDQISALCMALERHPIGSAPVEEVRPAPWSAQSFREEDERKERNRGRERMRY